MAGFDYLGTATQIGTQLGNFLTEKQRLKKQLRESKEEENVGNIVNDFKSQQQQAYLMSRMFDANGSSAGLSAYTGLTSAMPAVSNPTSNVSSGIKLGSSIGNLIVSGIKDSLKLSNKSNPLGEFIVSGIKDSLKLSNKSNPLGEFIVSGIKDSLKLSNKSNPLGEFKLNSAPSDYFYDKNAWKSYIDKIVPEIQSAVITPPVNQVQMKQEGGWMQVINNAVDVGQQIGDMVTDNKLNKYRSKIQKINNRINKNSIYPQFDYYNNYIAPPIKEVSPMPW